MESGKSKAGKGDGAKCDENSLTGKVSMIKKTPSPAAIAWQRQRVENLLRQRIRNERSLDRNQRIPSAQLFIIAEEEKIVLPTVKASRWSAAKRALNKPMGKQSDQGTAHKRRVSKLALKLHRKPYHSL